MEEKNQKMSDYNKLYMENVEKQRQQRHFSLQQTIDRGVETWNIKNSKLLEEQDRIRKNQVLSMQEENFRKAKQKDFDKEYKRQIYEKKWENVREDDRLYRDYIEQTKLERKTRQSAYKDYLQNQIVEKRDINENRIFDPKPFQKPGYKSFRSSTMEIGGGLKNIGQEIVRNVNSPTSELPAGQIVNRNGSVPAGENRFTQALYNPPTSKLRE